MLTDALADGHEWLGYLVFLVVLASVVRAVIGARRADEYTDGLARIAGLVLPLQWLYGIVTYVQAEAWNGTWQFAYAHPLLMTGGVALAGIATARAQRAQQPADAWMAVARFQGIALLLVIAGIGIVSAA